MSDDPMFLMVVWIACGLVAWLVALLYLVEWMFT